VHTWYKNKFGRVSQIWPHPVLDFWKIKLTVNLDDYNQLA
jgi:4-hydroxyacetophenone monooxygenase